MRQQKYKFPKYLDLMDLKDVTLDFDNLGSESLYRASAEDRFIFKGRKPSKKSMLSCFKPKADGDSGFQMKVKGPFRYFMRGDDTYFLLQPDFDEVEVTLTAKDSGESKKVYIEES